jgi:hypothetical protein
MNHKTLDQGAFTVADRVLLVSDLMNGTTGSRRCCSPFTGNPSAHLGVPIGSRSRSIGLARTPHRTDVTSMRPKVADPRGDGLTSGRRRAPRYFGFRQLPLWNGVGPG